MIAEVPLEKEIITELKAAILKLLSPVYRSKLIGGNP
jgi:hypothetical protein